MKDLILQKFFSRINRSGVNLFLCFFPLLVLHPYKLRQLPIWPRPPPLPPTTPERAASSLDCFSVLLCVWFLSLHSSAASVAPVRCPHTGTSRCCRVGQKFRRQQKTLPTSARVPDPCSPPPLMTSPLSLSHLTPPPPPPP